MRYIAELERKVETLQTEATTLSAQLTMIQVETKGSRTGRFYSSRLDPKAEDRTGQVGRAEADRR